jgi:hypothetical protein
MISTCRHSCAVRPRRPEGFKAVALRIIVALFVCSLVTPVASSGVSTGQISVLLLDESNGKPILGASILVGVPHSNPNVNKLRLQTDSQGRATFSFADSTPVRFSLIVGPDIELCARSFLTEQVLTSGAVQNFECGVQKFHYSPSPKPGELVVLARPVSVFERMLREL